MKLDLKKLALVAVPLIVIVIILIGVVKALGNVSKSTSSDSTTYQLAKQKAVATLNRVFTFPLGTTGGSFKFTLIDADLQKQIIVKGSRVTAIDGRIFLILNLKLANNQSQGLQVNTRDFIRLSVNGNTAEFFAPEIHNDPVDVHAISTQPARVGFPVNESDKNFVLRVGEINGKKQDVPLVFK